LNVYCDVFFLFQIEKQDALMDQSLDQIMGGVSCSALLARCLAPLEPTSAHIEQVLKLKAIALDITSEVKTQGRFNILFWFHVGSKYFVLVPCWFKIFCFGSIALASFMLFASPRLLHVTHLLL
jgi:hypothetical protein